LSQRHLISRALWLVLAMTWSLTVGANVFGEDQRQAAPLGGVDYAQGAAAAGTVHCDGRRRGSAMVVRLPEQPDTAVIVTAAHVLVDLQRNAPFAECAFHHLGLAQLPGNSWSLAGAHGDKGPFLGDEELHSADFGDQDWAFIAIDDPQGRLAGLRPMTWRDARDGNAEFFLLAWDDEAGRLAVSAPCRVLSSTADDLGGGAWAGQLLDDCDSGAGASGGGLLACTRDGVFLVGIRTGAHWSATGYPPDRFPEGPPEGAAWDAQANTNFARAMDAILLERLNFLVIQAGKRGETAQTP
jgi:hypothetical protein